MGFVSILNLFYGRECCGKENYESVLLPLKSVVILAQGIMTQGAKISSELSVYILLTPLIDMAYILGMNIATQFPFLQTSGSPTKCSEYILCSINVIQSCHDMIQYKKNTFHCIVPNKPKI